MEAFRQEDSMKQERKARQFLLRIGKHPMSSVGSLAEKKREGDLEVPWSRGYPLNSLPASEPR